MQDVQRVGYGLRHGNVEIGRGHRGRGFRVLRERDGDGTVPQGLDRGVRGPLPTGVVAGPADRGPRQPVPGEHQHQAAGTRGAPVHGQARDPARARLLREPVRLLPGRQRVPADHQGRQRQTQAEREVSNAADPRFYVQALCGMTYDL